MRLLITLTILCIVLVGCNEKPLATSSLTRYIPRKAAVIVKIDDVEDFVSDFNENEFLQNLTPTPAYKTLQEQLDYFSPISLTGETLFCFTQLGQNNYELSVVTAYEDAEVEGDSLGNQDKTVQNATIKSLNNQVSYLLHNGTLIASTSKILLENINRESAGVSNDVLFSKAYETAGARSVATIFIKGTEGKTLYNKLFPKAKNNPLDQSLSWVSADLDMDDQNVILNGVALVQDSMSLKLSLFKNTTPVTNRITQVTPHTAQKVEALTFSDWDQYKNNKADYLKIDPATYNLKREDFLATINEVGMIHLPKGKVVVAVTTDMLEAIELLTTNQSSTFRSVPIHDFTEKVALSKAFYPILIIPPLKKYAIIEDFFLFGENQQALETVIANYQNNATLAQSAAYTNTAEQLSTTSSYLNITNLQDGNFKKSFSKKAQKSLSKEAFNLHQYAATQLVQESDYLLLNMVLLKNENTLESSGSAQLANVKLNAAIRSNPQLVKNHRTNGMDIIVQDVNNTIHLISNTGKVLWQKKLDGEILGDVQQVDLYNNGRLQLAFVTPNKFYIIDRNGNNVAPYPVSFKDRITQPLAIFDYESNKKYRFVIAQAKKVLMYDKAAKAVKGFVFKEASSPILFPPKHVRIATKDYIVIAEENGTLNLLSRTGKIRIPIRQKIDFGNIPIYKENNLFTTVTTNGEKITINTDGKLATKDFPYSATAKATVGHNLLVAQVENKLYIDDTSKEIDYGSYGQPTINKAGRDRYIALTNTETNQVFIYDYAGELLPQLPVYGESKAAVGYLENNSSLGFVTLGGENSILIYKID